ncbi:DNA polymerase III subunit delta [Saccharospirillum salsuginis]|uniref:DNA polymerase III subunit delta n=1 Tax=Saccharospirillum salsuginis TaxID=418750 RepID=A0A918K071_9GAMM|nr:DNA polymerase III subunit delta [Saccharospirillum salsuginis]GGX41178.1 DNA polymerase III subunit delta [Saccharospirillum salsuginis]
MKLSLQQLDKQLSQGLPSIIWISGDEPLLVLEAADRVRAAARNAGISERQVFHADNQFDWNQLTDANQSMSLFGDREILELRLPGKLNDEGRKTLVAYAESANPDNLLMIVSDRIEAAQSKAKWFGKVTDAGWWVPVWPIERHQLPAWLRQRLQQQGLTIDDDALALLADRVDGNLLAARQEIDKLLLMNEGDNTAISLDTVIQSVADSARFDIFDLSDAFLSGDLARSQRVLSGLAAEGIEAPIVLWVLARELRHLVQLSEAQAQGQILAGVFKRLRIFDKRQGPYQTALRRAPGAHWQRCLIRCGEIDATIKGRREGNPWHKLSVLVSEVAQPGLVPAEF